MQQYRKRRQELTSFFNGEKLFCTGDSQPYTLTGRRHGHTRERIANALESITSTNGRPLTATEAQGRQHPTFADILCPGATDATGYLSYLITAAGAERIEFGRIGRTA